MKRNIRREYKFNITHRYWRGYCNSELATPPPCETLSVGHDHEYGSKKFRGKLVHEGYGEENEKARTSFRVTMK